ncbi:MAG TPA: CBS domain-containing protein [Dehalococcoidia bacterium]|nr:CBS domain-containing protein [Dehalococcoidia bacterium]
MASERPIERKTTVQEVIQRLKGPSPCLVRPDDDVMALVEGAVRHPEVETLAVVDDEGRLLGIIPLRLLLDELFLSVVPEEFLLTMRDIDDIEEFARISRAKRARDLMQPPVSVRADDTVGRAFALLHEGGLLGIPVVDEAGRVTSYLDSLQLIALWLGAAPPPQQGQG